MCPDIPNVWLTFPLTDCGAPLSLAPSLSSVGEGKAQRLTDSSVFTMSVSPSLARLSASFLAPSHPKLSALRPAVRNQRPPPSYPRIKAVEFDQNTLVAISVGIVSIAVGIGIPVFYETQIDSSAKRENKQPCFPCNGSGAQLCRFCMGSGTVTVDLGGDEKEASRCINCDGVGSLTCTTCQGSGIQPRYLDRREFKDDD